MVSSETMYSVSAIAPGAGSMRKAAAQSRYIQRLKQCSITVPELY